MTTLTPDLLAHVAAVRDGACDDNDLLVLADALDEAATDALSLAVPLSLIHI